jgi:hypothetical protein
MLQIGGKAAPLNLCAPDCAPRALLSQWRSETDIAWLARRNLPEWVPLTSMNGMALESRILGNGVLPVRQAGQGWTARHPTGP